VIRECATQPTEPSHSNENTITHCFVGLDGKKDQKSVKLVKNSGEDFIVLVKKKKFCATVAL